MFKSPVFRWLSLSVFIVGSAQSQVPSVPVAFPSNHACTPGQLLFRQVGLGRVTNIMYHNGHIYSNNVAADNPRHYIFTNPADPSSLQIQSTPNLRSMADQGNHGNTKVGDWLAGYWSMGYQRAGVGVNNVVFNPPEWISFSQQPPAPDSGQHRNYYPWSVPFNWLQYGPTPGSGRIYRGTELLTEWEPLADHGIAGNSILLGNVLFLTSDASMLGVAAYDIGPLFDDPPGEIELIDRLPGVVGAYIGAIWEDYLVLAGGSDRDIFQVVDISDLTNMQLIKTFDLSGTAAMNAGTSVPYVQTQDQFVFTRRHKIDMELLEVVLEFDEVGDNRPPGSVAGALDVSQYTLPLGNLMISGGYSAAGRDGVGVWCHQAAPDTRAPYVGYHIPRDGQSNYPLGAPVSLVIAEELESFTVVNGVSFIVRPVGGAPVDGITSFSHDGVLTFTPDEYFAPDTTYEVIVPGGGIKDVAGNGIEGYSFTFATGSSVGGGNSSPQIAQVSTSLSPSQPGQNVLIATTANDPESDPMEYRFVFGDGTPATAWSVNGSVNHAFSEAGHYNVKAQVRDIKPDGTSSVVTETYTQSVVISPTGPRPVSSSMLALDAAARVVWTVNPDNNSVARIHADTRALIETIGLGPVAGVADVHPQSVAVDAAGRAWIAARDSDQLIVLDAQGDAVDVIDTGHGSAPQAVLISADGTSAYVSLRGRGSSDAGNGQVVRYSTAGLNETGRVEVGPAPRAMALSGDGAQLFVAAFVSARNHGLVWEISTAGMSIDHEIVLHRDRGTSGLDAGGSDGPGVPNYIADLVISPDHQWLWYTAIKADTNRGVFFDQGTGLNLPSAHDSTLRGMLGRIDLGLNPPQEPEFVGFTSDVSRVDVDNADSPSSLAFSPNGDYVFVALQGNDTLAVFDDFAIRAMGGVSSLWRSGTGFAPQGLLMDPSNNNLWVKNLMSRDVSVYDMNAFIATGDAQFSTATVASSSSELLAADVLSGKRAFYFAGNHPVGDNEMSFEGYIACASCHIDGAHDGRTWDFTQRGEGLRNTTDLRGRRGTGHGNVHWSANFDEIQDFVLDIVNHFGGNGFLNPGETPNASLGAPNGGLHAELDDLSAYVTSLNAATLPASPYRNFDGSKSAAALAGAAVFTANGCAGCHVPGNDFNDSELGSNPQLHNVGTLRDSSGQRLGGPLNGVDTPTLLGLWDSAPYLHNGVAETLADVFSAVGGANHQAESGALLGGAEIPDYIEINYDSSAYGRFVRMPGTGDGFTLTGVDGGSGGLADIEVRAQTSNTSQAIELTIEVNGTPHSLMFSVNESRLDWHTARLHDVALNAGTGNTVSVLRAGSNGTITVDQLVIGNADVRALAAAHRVALGLSGVEFDNLLAFLLQLDGSDSAFGGDDVIFANGFD